MWINKKTLDWNPWDTDPYQKKRPCHIKGLQKMNEYSMVKQHQDADKNKQKQGMQKSLSKMGLSGKGSYSTEFATLHYIDKDMSNLANNLQGTTSKYNYSAG